MKTLITSLGGLTIGYNPEKDGHRFAFIKSDGKWSPRELHLVELTGGSGKSTNVLKTLTDVVVKKVKNEGGAFNGTIELKLASGKAGPELAAIGKVTATKGD